MLRRRSRLGAGHAVTVLLMLMCIAVVISIGSAVYADSEVEGIEYIPVNAGGIQVIENYSGYWLTDGDSQKYFYYGIRPCKGDVLKVKYKDGTVEEYTNVYEEMWRLEDEQRYLWLNFDSTQYEQHWTLHGKYAVTVEYEGKTCEITAEVVENPVEQISFVHQGGYTYEEGLNISSYQGTTPIYSLPFFSEGDQLKVVYNDGRGTIEYTYYDKSANYGFRDSQGNIIPEGDVSENDTQEEHPWTPGGDNYFDIWFLGKSVSVPVTVVPSKVKAISFTPKKPYTFTEDYISDDYHWMDVDALTCYRKGDVLTVTYSDERGSVDYVYKSASQSFVCSDGSKISEYDVVRKMPGFDNKWALGKENSFQITFAGATTMVPVSITETPVNQDDQENQVKEIDYQPAQPYVYIKDVSMDWEGSYAVPRPGDGDKLNVTYLNGSTKTYVFDSTSYSYVNNDDRISGNGVNLRLLQGPDWNVGEEGVIQVKYSSRTCEVPAVLKENTLKEIIYNDGKPVTFYEGLDANLSKGYLAYDLDMKVPITLVFQDGTQRKLTYSGGGMDFSYYVGNCVHIYVRDLKINSDQDKFNVWTAGGKDYHFTLSFAGVTSTVPVQIVECPVTSIDYEQIRPLKINKDADIYKDVYSGYYSFRKVFQDGDRLIFNKKDGSKSVYECNCEKNFEGSWDIFFVNEEDDKDIINASLYFNGKAGSGTRLVSLVGGENWWIPGDNTFYVTYGTLKTPITITVDERVTKSISYTPVQGDSIKIVENINGRTLNLDGEDVYCYYLEKIKPGKGDKITVKYTDNSTNEYVSNGEVFISDDKDVRDIWLSSKDDSPWVVGGTYQLSVGFMDRQCETKVKVISAEEAAAQEKLEKELAEAKAAAKTTLAGYKDVSDYSPEQQTELENAIADGNKAIEAATSKQAVEEALQQAKAVIDAIPIAVGSKTPVRQTDVATAAEGNVLVPIRGTFSSESVETVLERLNQIRYEACQEGVPDPRNSSRKLTPDDYKPIKWSSALEKIAQTRAAEATVFQSHTRPNQSLCFTCKYDGQSSFAENLAWDCNGMISGINMWYEEKTDWVDQKSDAVTGHYTSLINPSYNHVALGRFVLSTSMCSTVSAEFSVSTGLDEKKVGVAGLYDQMIEVPQGQADAYAKYAGNCKPLSDHNLTKHAAKDATCTEDGNITYWSCSVCQGVFTDKDGKTKVKAVDVVIKAKGHDFGDWNVVRKATYEKEGIEERECQTCHDKEQRNLPKLEKISIARASVGSLKTKVYTGKGQTQAPVVTLNGNALKAGTDYVLTYKNNVAVGTATVVITGKGKYQGAISKAFVINPKPAVIMKPVAAKKAITVKWKKLVTLMPKARITGYQIQCSTDKKFKTIVKSATVKGYSKTSKKLSGLKAKKTYHVRVRAYMTVGGKNYYSAWSTVRSVKTK